MLHLADALMRRQVRLADSTAWRVALSALAVALMLLGAGPAGARADCGTSADPSYSCLSVRVDARPDSEHSHWYVSATRPATGQINTIVGFTPGSSCPPAPTAGGDFKTVFSSQRPATDPVDRTITADWIFDVRHAGPYVMCGWMTNGQDGTVYQRQRVPFTVAPAPLTLAVTSPQAVTAGAPFTVTVGFGAPVPRDLSVFVVRDTACPQSTDSADGAEQTLDYFDSVGPGAGDRVFAGVRVAQPGRLLVCALLERSDADVDVPAEKIASAALVVQPSTATRRHHRQAKKPWARRHRPHRRHRRTS